MRNGHGIRKVPIENETSIDDVFVKRCSGDRLSGHPSHGALLEYFNKDSAGALGLNHKCHEASDLEHVRSSARERLKAGAGRPGDELFDITDKALEKELTEDERLVVHEIHRHQGDNSPAFEKVVREITRRRAQHIFRAAVWGAGRGVCAVTGVGVRDALETAHLNRRGLLGGAETMGQQTDPSRGIILRQDLHALYDNGKMTIRAGDGAVLFCAAAMQHPDYRRHAGRKANVSGKDRKLLQEHNDFFNEISRRKD